MKDLAAFNVREVKSVPLQKDSKSQSDPSELSKIKRWGMFLKKKVGEKEGWSVEWDETKESVEVQCSWLRDPQHSIEEH